MSFRRIDGCELRVERRLALVVVLLWDQSILVKVLPALELELGVLEVGLRLYQIRLRRLIRRLSGLYARLGRIDRRSLRLHVRVRLNIFLSQQDLPLLDVVALLDYDRGNPAIALRRDVGKGGWLNLTRGGHHRNQRVLW